MINLLKASFFVLLTFIAFSCSEDGKTSEANQKRLSLFERAKGNSQQIINDINSPAFLSHFRNNPHFSDSIKPILMHTKLNYECRTDPSQVTYFDHFKEVIRDSAHADIVNFFYEGPSTCNDLRFMITYKLLKKTDQVHLIRFRVEPAMKRNDFIDNIYARRAKEQAEGRAN